MLTYAESVQSESKQVNGPNVYLLDEGIFSFPFSFSVRWVGRRKAEPAMTANKSAKAAPQDGGGKVTGNILGRSVPLLLWASYDQCHERLGPALENGSDVFQVL